MFMTRPQDEPIYDSDLGNLYGPITRIRDNYPYAAESFAGSGFKAGDYDSWRMRTKQFVLEQMSYRPAGCDFDVEVVEKVDCGSYRREKIYFNTTPELRVGAYVLVPKNIKGKAPAILALHDHGGFYRWGKEKLIKLPGENPALTEHKIKDYDGHSIADDLAEQGYLVMAIDMFGWGERRMRRPEDPATGAGETAGDVEKFNGNMGWGGESLIARSMITGGFNWTGVLFWDDSRCVDYLLSRGDVDPSRIGCVGLSGGGSRSLNLAGLDERIKCAIDVCFLTSFRDIQSKYHITWTAGFTEVTPGIYRKIDLPDIASMAAPRPFLCICGKQDKLFPLEGVAAAIKTVETVYGKISAGDKFRGSWYDAPHQFNAAMQKEAWDWFKKWL